MPDTDDDWSYEWKLKDSDPEYEAALGIGITSGALRADGWEVVPDADIPQWITDEWLVKPEGLVLMRRPASMTRAAQRITKHLMRKQLETAMLPLRTIVAENGFHAFGTINRLIPDGDGNLQPKPDLVFDETYGGGSD